MLNFLKQAERSLPGLRTSCSRLTVVLPPSGSDTCIYGTSQALQASTAARPVVTTFVILTTPRPVLRLSYSFSLCTATSFLYNTTGRSSARVMIDRSVQTQPWYKREALTSRPAPLPSRAHCGASAGPGPKSSSGSTAKREPPVSNATVRH